MHSGKQKPSRLRVLQDALLPEEIHACAELKVCFDANLPDRVKKAFIRLPDSFGRVPIRALMSYGVKRRAANLMQNFHTLELIFAWRIRCKA